MPITNPDGSITFTAAEVAEYRGARPGAQQSPHAPAAPTAPADPDAVYASNALAATREDFARLVAKHGEYKAGQIVQAALNRQLENVKLVADRRSR